MIYGSVSLVWSLAAIATVALDAGPLAFLVAGSYLVIGAGLPAGIIMSRWPELARGRETRLLTGGLLAVVFSFSASALGGQPLIWTSNWTPEGHLVAALVASILLTALVMARQLDEPNVALAD